MLHARVVRPRGQGANGDGTAPKVLSRRRDLDQPHPGRQVVQIEQLPRRRRAEGVRRDPGCSSAEGHLGADPTLPGVGNFWSSMRKPATRPANPARALQQPRQRRRRDRRARRRPCRRRTSTTYNGFVPIGPTCAVADVTSGGARDLHERAGLSTTLAGSRWRHSRWPGSTLPANQVRVICCEGASCLRRRPQDDCACAAARDLAASPASRCACSGCAGTSTAGTTTARRSMYDVSGGVDAERQDRRAPTGRHLRPGSAARIDPTELHGTRRAPRTRSAAASSTPTNIGHAVQDPEPAGAREDAAAPERRASRASFLRAPNAPQRASPASRSIDELAYAAKMDPIAFRLQNITSNADRDRRTLPLRGIAGRTS